MIDRARLLSAVQVALARSPAVALVGPRQVGKTTLARQLLGPGSAQWFDLEDPPAVAALAAPLMALQGLRGPVVIDEVQHAPDLFKVLRVLVDRPDNAAGFRARSRRRRTTTAGPGAASSSARPWSATCRNWA